MSEKKRKKEQATTISVDKDTMIIVDELKKKLGIKNASELMRMAVREKYERDVNLGIDLPTLYTQFKEFKMDVYRMMMNSSGDSTSVSDGGKSANTEINQKIESALMPYTKLIQESTNMLLSKLDQNEERYKELEKSFEKFDKKKIKN